MEFNESRSLNWKTCFKDITHLLNPSEEQSDSVSTSAFMTNLEKLENVQKNINSSISVESDIGSHSFIDNSHDFDLPYKLYNAKNSIQTEESVANIIDADELAKSFTALKVKRKAKYCYNMAESSNAPDWKTTFRTALDPKPVPESSLRTREELCKKMEHLKNLEVTTLSSSENCNKESGYSKEEKKVLEILKQARTFQCAEKHHMNIFDGAGVNCFKDREIKSSTKNMLSNTKKPKNVPPPGGWVCVKPVTIEEARNRPPNIIYTECWDWDDDW